MSSVINNNKFYLSKRSRLISIVAIIICLLFWIIPYLHNLLVILDQQFFLTINKTLLWSVAWYKFWGYLNHPAESWLNLVLMLTINFGAVKFLPKEQRKSAIIFIFYCWFMFQLGLLLSHLIFHRILAITRASPSLIIRDGIRLSALVSHAVKDSSVTSFPAGHTFVLIYWAGFTKQYVNNIFKLLVYLVVIVLIFPRLISGAHWLTDIIATVVIAYAWLTIVFNSSCYLGLGKKLQITKYLE